VLASALYWVGLAGIIILAIYHFFSIYSAFKAEPSADYLSCYIHKEGDIHISYSEAVHAFLAFASLALALFGTIFPYNGPRGPLQVEVHFRPVIKRFLNTREDSIDVSLSAASNDLFYEDDNGKKVILATADKSDGKFKLAADISLKSIIDKSKLYLSFSTVSEDYNVKSILEKYKKIYLIIKYNGGSGAQDHTVEIFPKFKDKLLKTDPTHLGRGIYWDITDWLETKDKDPKNDADVFQFITKAYHINNGRSQ
jgi:hypothetical protein